VPLIDGHVARLVLVQVFIANVRERVVELLQVLAMTVEGGLVTQHRFYFDQMELLGQLGLLPENALLSTEPRRP